MKLALLLLLAQPPTPEGEWLAWLHEDRPPEYKAVFVGDGKVLWWRADEVAHKFLYQAEWRWDARTWSWAEKRDGKHDLWRPNPITGAFEAGMWQMGRLR